MPRLRRKPKQKRTDFVRALAEFLRSERKLWFCGRYIAVRCGKKAAYLKYAAAYKGDDVDHPVALAAKLHGSIEVRLVNSNFDGRGLVPPYQNTTC